jgi:trehalose 6-phosphate phosphatase
MPIPALPLSPALAQRLSGRPFLLLLDIDGTLSPIAPRPAEAIVTPDTRRAICTLVGLAGTHVALISGRAAGDARRLVGVDSVWVIGNHGIEVAPPNKGPTVRADVARFAEQVAAASARCAETARRYPGVVVEDKHWTLSVHYRTADRAIVPELEATVLEIARELGLKVTYGKEVLEVRPPVDIDKGTAAVDLARTLGAMNDDASIFCAGDDQTDEDAFRALRAVHAASVTVRVGATATAASSSAEFSVNDPDQMRALLEAIVEQRSAGVT